MTVRRLIILLCLFTVLVMANPTSAATSTRINETEDFVDATSNLHLATPDIGTHSVFADLQDYGANYDQMQEEDTGVAGNDFEHFVNQTSNLHDPADKGTHDAFGDLQAKDTTYDTLTEANQGGAGGSEWLSVNADDSTYTEWDNNQGVSPWLGAASDGNYLWELTSNSMQQGWFDFPSTTLSGDLTVNVTGYVQNADGLGNDHIDVFLDYVAGAGALVGILDCDTTWAYYTFVLTGTYTVAEVNTMRIYLDTHNVGQGDDIYIDHLRLGVSAGGADDYELDLEVQFTDVDYDETGGEELCVYGGTQPSEALRVDVWHSGAWLNIISDVATDDWSNVSISTYLTSDTIEFRFIDTDQSDDSSADTWDVDALLIHAWTDASTNYELDLEVGWTVDTDFDETEEWLCIYPVTGGGWPSEAIKVDIWDGTWTNLWADLTPDQWNNISIASYLTSVDVEVRFLGGTETGDTTQDTWEIDAVLIHTYSYAYTENRDEVVTIDETLATAAGFARDFSENITIDESISTFVTIVKALFEALAVAVSLTTTASLKKLLSESILLSPTFSEVGIFARAFFENITFDETVSTQLIVQKFLFEAVVMTVTIGTATSFSRRLGESIVLSPTFNEIGTFVREYFEGVTFADSVEATKLAGGDDYEKFLFESIILSDSESLASSFVRVLSESIVISDTINTTFIGLWLKSLVESFLFGENDVWADYRVTTPTTTFNPDKRRYIIPPIFPPNLVMAGLGVGLIVWIYFYGVPYIAKSEATAYNRRMKLKRELQKIMRPILAPMGVDIFPLKRLWKKLWKTKRKKT